MNTPLSTFCVPGTLITKYKSSGAASAHVARTLHCIVPFLSP